jgi:hypothetical protein
MRTIGASILHQVVRKYGMISNTGTTAAKLEGMIKRRT